MARSKKIYYLLANLSIIYQQLVCSSDTHIYNTLCSSNEKLEKYLYRTKTYGKNVITVSAIESWINSQN